MEIHPRMRSHHVLARMRVRASKRADAGSQEQLGLSVEQSEGNDGTISAAPYGVRFPARSDV